MDTNNLEFYAGTDLQLSVRTFNLLKRAGIDTIQDLYNSSLIQLYEFSETNPVDYVRLLQDMAKLFEAILINRG